MATRLIALAMLTAAATASAGYSTMGRGFAWPEASAVAIPDVRLNDLIGEAKEAAQQAADRAQEGRRVAARAKRHSAVRGVIGLGAKPVTIDDGTVMTAVPFTGESGPMIGTVTYPSGASMVGAFGPDVGVYQASPESSNAEFDGWCYGARSSNPQPTDGEFTFKSGDVFVGTRVADNFTGIYRSADGSREFIGEVLLNSSTPRPVQGIMRDGSGRLLAVLTGPR